MPHRNPDTLQFNLNNLKQSLKQLSFLTGDELKNIEKEISDLNLILNFILSKLYIYFYKYHFF